MKKRIFISIYYLHIGGVERSLLGLLNTIDTTNYDVDLFIFSHEGELMKSIPTNIKILPEIKQYAQLNQPLKNLFFSGHLKIGLARLWAKFLFFWDNKKEHFKDATPLYTYISRYASFFLPHLFKYGEYDLAISFVMPHLYTLKKVKAKKKIAWIHTDYSKIGVIVNKELPIWEGYDYIASISPDVTRTFLSIFPTLAGKIIEIANILSPQMVKQQSLADKINFPTQNGRINLLSVGRFTFAKNFDNVPDICRRILQEGCDVYWYIVGYGGDEQLIKEKIKEAGMEEHVILLGKQENPYPFIKGCDIYVQPSRFEGNAVTVREAQILCKPVIVANYPTAHSQIKQGTDGIIVPQDNAGCAHEIAQFIKNKELQQNIVSYLKEHDYGNEKEVQKLYSLMN